MTQSDDDILELLQNDPAGPLNLSPKNVAANTDWSLPTVKRRLGELLDAGLVEHHDKSAGIYRITEKGLDYLDGSLDKDELER